MKDASRKRTESTGESQILLTALALCFAHISWEKKKKTTKLTPNSTTTKSHVSVPLFLLYCCTPSFIRPLCPPGRNCPSK